MNFVKRVIGLPGDKVEFRDDHVYINDEMLPEHRVIGDTTSKVRAISEVEALKTREFEDRQPNENYSVYYSEDSIKNHTSDPKNPNMRSEFDYAAPGKPVIVPPDSYFCMGDSRDKSLDSRFWGFVPSNLVVGRAMFVYWSCDRAASGNSMFGCLTNPRLDRIGRMIK